MKRRIYTLLLTLILCIGALPFFGSCSKSVDLLDGYDVCVTYYFNGGKMSMYESRTSLDVYYKPSTPIVEPGEGKALNKVTLRGKYIIGWYYAELDDDGNVIFNTETGNPYASEKEFDFATERPTESLSLVAKWGAKIRVTYKNLTWGKVDYYEDLSDGDMLSDPGLTQTSDKRPIEGFYWDEAFTEEVDFENDISFSELNDRLGDEPEMDGDYTLLYIYVKVGEKK